MRSTAVSLLVLAATTASANAEPTTQYIGLSGTAGATLWDKTNHLPRLHLNAGAAIDGGMRVAANSPIFVHAEFGAGSSGKVGYADHNDPSGSYVSGRGGLELRGCARWFCGFGGLDVGGIKYNYELDAMNGATSFVQIVPRAGFEFGTTTRVRSTLELPLHTAEGTHPGITYALGVVHSF